MVSEMAISEPPLKSGSETRLDLSLPGATANIFNKLPTREPSRANAHSRAQTFRQASTRTFLTSCHRTSTALKRTERCTILGIDRDPPRPSSLCSDLEHMCRTSKRDSLRGKCNRTCNLCGYACSSALSSNYLIIAVHLPCDDSLG